MFSFSKRICQSCGMPIKDENLRGTNDDGTKSSIYCKYCFENGAFLQPHITVDEMRQLVNSRMLSMGIPSFAAKMITKNVRKLDRWQV